MAPRLSSLLALGLLLGQEILTAEGILPAPSISVKHGRATRRGRTVTIVCRAKGSFEIFRLEQCSAGSHCTVAGEVANAGTSHSVARFHLTLMITGHYSCIYSKASTWSPRSEILEVDLTPTDATQTSSPPASTVPSDSTSPRATQTPVDDSHLAAHGLEAQHVYLLIGASVGFLLLLLLLILFCLCRWRQNKQSLLGQQDQKQRPQERCSLARVSLGRTADQATADRPLPQGREQSLSDPQEVTYAQLDLQALTLRRAPEVFPKSTVESSTYAVLA